MYNYPSHDGFWWFVVTVAVVMTVLFFVGVVPKWFA